MEKRMKMEIRTLASNSLSSVPQVLVLNDCGIDRAGKAEELQKKCYTVKELDLAQNNLENWNEVRWIVELTENINDAWYDVYSQLWKTTASSHFFLAHCQVEVPLTQFSLLHTLKIDEKTRLYNFHFFFFAFPALGSNFVRASEIHFNCAFARLQRCLRFFFAAIELWIMT